MRIIFIILFPFLLIQCNKNFNEKILGKWQEVGKKCDPTGKNCENNPMNYTFTREFLSSGTMKQFLRDKDDEIDKDVVEFKNEFNYSIKDDELILKNDKSYISSKIIKIDNEEMALSSKFEGKTYIDKYVKMNNK